MVLQTAWITPWVTSDVEALSAGLSCCETGSAAIAELRRLTVYISLALHTATR